MLMTESMIIMLHHEIKSQTRKILKDRYKYLKTFILENNKLFVEIVTEYTEIHYTILKDRIYLYIINNNNFKTILDKEISIGDNFTDIDYITNQSEEIISCIRRYSH